MRFYGINVCIFSGTVNYEKPITDMQLQIHKSKAGKTYSNLLYLVKKRLTYFFYIISKIEKSVWWEIRWWHKWGEKNAAEHFYLVMKMNNDRNADYEKNFFASTRLSFFLPIKQTKNAISPEKE